MTIKSFTLVLSFLFSPLVLAQSFSDGQISEILQTINTGEMDAAQIAMKNVRNNEVRDFAKMMQNEHTANQKALNELGKSEKIERQASDLSRQIKVDALQSNKSLQDGKREEFDARYITEQVNMHQRALAVLDTNLIPNATHPKLKQMLEKTKVAVSSHLEQAKNLKTKLQ